MTLCCCFENFNNKPNVRHFVNILISSDNTQYLYRKLNLQIDNSKGTTGKKTERSLQGKKVGCFHTVFNKDCQSCCDGNLNSTKKFTGCWLGTSNTLLAIMAKYGE